MPNDVARSPLRVGDLINSAQKVWLVVGNPTSEVYVLVAPCVYGGFGQIKPYVERAHSDSVSPILRSYKNGALVKFPLLVGNWFYTNRAYSSYRMATLKEARAFDVVCPGLRDRPKRWM